MRGKVSCLRKQHDGRAPAPQQRWISINSYKFYVLALAAFKLSLKISIGNAKLTRDSQEMQYIG